MRTWIEIDAMALQHNIALIAALSGDAEIAIVVKGNAYGHGMKQIATLLAPYTRIAWLMVGGVEEALELADSGISQKLLVLFDVEGRLEEAIERNIVFPVFNAENALRIIDAARRVRRHAVVHLKVDTGMHRLGILPEELPAFMAWLQQYSELIVDGLFTHLASTNDADTSHCEHQIALFNAVCQTVDPEHRLYQHSIASGYLWYKPIGDVVRVGTMLYGSWKSVLHQNRIIAMIPEASLKPIMTWKTRIIACKKLSAGDVVGYDRTFCAPQEMRIAVLPIGYADGYSRRLSRGGVVMIKDSYTPVVGIISMNMMMVDITAIDAEVGDEVTLMGPYDHISPLALATLLQSNPNDITTRVHPTIPRFVVRGTDAND